MKADPISEALLELEGRKFKKRIDRLEKIGVRRADIRAMVERDFPADERHLNRMLMYIGSLDYLNTKEEISET